MHWRLFALYLTPALSTSSTYRQQRIYVARQPKVVLIKFAMNPQQGRQSPSPPSRQSTGLSTVEAPSPLMRRSTANRLRQFTGQVGEGIPGSISRQTTSDTRRSTGVWSNSSSGDPATSQSSPNTELSESENEAANIAALQQAALGDEALEQELLELWAQLP